MATEANKAKFRAALEGAVDKYVKQQGRNTIALNAERDSACAGYARIPGPDACEFCVTMGAANDFYRTEESAGGGAGHGSKDDAYHAHCNCQICMVFRRAGRLVARDPETGEAVPYDGAEMVRRYNEAGRPTFEHNRALENENRRIRRHGGEPSGSRSAGSNARTIKNSLDYIRSAQTAEEVELRFAEVYSQYKRQFGKDGMLKYVQSARGVGKRRVEELRIANVSQVEGAAKSIKEAAEVANDLGVRLVVYDDLSLEVANSVNCALLTLPPDAMPKAVSSARNLQKAVDRKFGKLKEYHGVTVDMHSTINFYRVTGDMAMVDFDGGVCVGINVPKGKGLAGIAERKRAFNRQYRAKTGKSWYYNESGETVAYHEIGHVYDKHYGLPEGFEEAAKKWAKEAGCDMLKDPHEAWAEAWAAYHTGEDKLPAEIRSFIVNASTRSRGMPSSVKHASMDGAKRVALYGHGWSEHSVSDAVKRLVPDAKRIEKNKAGKVRYVSDKSSLQVIVDEENGYFRIIDSAASSGKQSYVGIDGKPLDCDKITAGEYERLTHFRIKG